MSDMYTRFETPFSVAIQLFHVIVHTKTLFILNKITNRLIILIYSESTRYRIPLLFLILEIGLDRVKNFQVPVVNSLYIYVTIMFLPGQKRRLAMFVTEVNYRSFLHFAFLHRYCYLCFLHCFILQYQTGKQTIKEGHVLIFYAQFLETVNHLRLNRIT